MALFGILVGLIVGLVGLGIAAWTDAKHHRIPNRLIAVMSFFFPANAYTLNLFLVFALVFIGLVVQWLIGRKQVVPFAPCMFAASVVVTVFGVWNTLRVL